MERVENVRNRFGNLRRFVQKEPIGDRPDILWQGSPVSIGKEVEQGKNTVGAPDHVFAKYSKDDSDFMDPSGPAEIQLPRGGGVSYPKAILKEFDAFTTEAGGIWKWHHDLPANERRSGAGCGCHLHFAPIHEDYRDIEINSFRAIIWNTIVELVPFMSPFWSFRWIQPSWRGQNDPDNRSVAYWAKPFYTRYSPSTMREQWGRAPGTSYPVVTFKSSDGNKPTTVEVRCVETHPSMSMTGASLFRSILGRCMDRERDIGDGSVKIDGVYDRRGRGEKVLTREEFFDNLYSSIYNLDMGLRDNMMYPRDRDHRIVFYRDRNIPGRPRKAKNALDVFLGILTEYTRNTGSFKDRIARLARSHFKYNNISHNPPENNDQLWDAYIYEPGHFSWRQGPEVK